MSAAKLTPEQWREVRAADEAGVAIEVLVDRYGVTSNNIRQRRHKEKWMTPRKLQEESMVQEARRKAQAMSNGSLMHLTAPSALALTAENMVEKAKEGTLKAMEIFLNGINRSHEEGGIITPKTAKDVLTAMKGLRMGAGLDSEKVTINIAGFWGAGKSEEREAKGIVIEQD